MYYKIEFSRLFCFSYVLWGKKARAPSKGPTASKKHSEKIDLNILLEGNVLIFLM